jgi:hypothetical protein
VGVWGLIEPIAERIHHTHTHGRVFKDQAI